MLNNLLRLIQVESRGRPAGAVGANPEDADSRLVLDQAFPTHGLWKGELSFGEVAGVWLMFVTSPRTATRSSHGPSSAARASAISSRRPSLMENR